MTEANVEIILQRGLEKYPRAKPRVISDNGPQFIARDFKELSSSAIIALISLVLRLLFFRVMVRYSAGC